jgi:hypothetical protein
LLCCVVLCFVLCGATTSPLRRFTTEGGKLLSATFDDVLVFSSMLLPLVVCLAVCLALGESLTKNRALMGEFR